MAWQAGQEMRSNTTGKLVASLGMDYVTDLSKRAQNRKIFRSCINAHQKDTYRKGIYLSARVDRMTPSSGHQAQPPCAFTMAQRQSGHESR